VACGSAASPNSIINDLIFITSDGSTSLNEFQGVVCVRTGTRLLGYPALEECISGGAEQLWLCMFGYRPCLYAHTGWQVRAIMPLLAAACHRRAACTASPSWTVSGRPSPKRCHEDFAISALQSNIADSLNRGRFPVDVSGRGTRGFQRSSRG